MLWRWLCLKVDFIIDMSEYKSKSLEVQAKFQASVPIVMKSVGAQIKAYAQANAPWTDRTGNARQGLHCRTQVSKNEIAVVLYHTMEYGYWLELAHQRRYKILEESIEAKVPDMIEALKGLL